VRILIADDHALFRNGLRSLLESRGHEVIGEARNGKEAIALAGELHPDMLLMDLSMPELDGLSATRALTAEAPDVKVIILTASQDEASLFDAIKAGAQGYLLKDLEADDFFSLLDRAALGEPALTPGLARRLLQEFAKPAAVEATSQDDPEALTAREREVLELMVDGVTSNRRLAKRLNVSENTVKFHVRNILDKLRLHTRA
jgi:DNA-binding NarL/FixJ family response regulator